MLLLSDVLEKGLDWGVVVSDPRFTLVLQNSSVGGQARQDWAVFHHSVLVVLRGFHSDAFSPTSISPQGVPRVGKARHSKC